MLIVSQKVLKKIGSRVVFIVPCDLGMHSGSSVNNVIPGSPKIARNGIVLFQTRDHHFSICGYNMEVVQDQFWGYLSPTDNRQENIF